MTYETGTATDVADLLAKLSTFAVTTHGGWTAGYSPNPNTTNGWFELHKGSLSFGARYAVGAQAPALHLGLYQASAFLNSSTAPGAHTGDSGNGWNTSGTGHTNANLLSERCARDLGGGPFPSYHFFADDGPDYIHCVVEPVTGMARHFGFGNLLKFGDNWVGGEYVYGHNQDAGSSSTAIDLQTTVLLDGLVGQAERLQCATVRIASGLLNQGAAVYGVSCAAASANLLNDTAGNVRRQIHGGFRGGMEARGFGNPVGTFSSGVIPMYSVPAYYRDPTAARVQLLGYLKDIRGLNIRNFSFGEEITIGSDVWVLFPLSIRTVASVANRSEFSGIAYRKVA